MVGLGFIRIVRVGLNKDAFSRAGKSRAIMGEGTVYTPVEFTPTSGRFNETAALGKTVPQWEGDVSMEYWSLRAVRVLQYLLLGLACQVSLAEELTGIVMVEISGLKGATGSVFIAVYDSDSTWLSDKTVMDQKVVIATLKKMGLAGVETANHLCLFLSACRNAGSSRSR